MQNIAKLLSAASITMMVFCAAAQADSYKITAIDNNGTFAGCLAQNEAAGLGVVAVGSDVAVLAESKTFGFAEGAAVSGSWSVDGGRSTDFSSKANHAGIATLDVPNSPEAVTALTTGRQLEVTANGTKARFDLSGTGEAFNALVQCMQTKKAP